MCISEFTDVLHFLNHNVFEVTSWRTAFRPQHISERRRFLTPVLSCLIEVSTSFEKVSKFQIGELHQNSAPLSISSSKIGRNLFHSLIGYTKIKFGKLKKFCNPFLQAKFGKVLFGNPIYAFKHIANHFQAARKFIIFSIPIHSLFSPSFSILSLYPS